MDNLAVELSLLVLISISLLRGNSSFDTFAKVFLILLISATLLILLGMMLVTKPIVRKVIRSVADKAQRMFRLVKKNAPPQGTNLDKTVQEETKSM